MNKRNHQRGGTVIKNDKEKYQNVIVELKNEPNGFDPIDSDQFKYIQTNKKSNGKDLVFVNDYNELDENTNFDQYSL